METSAIDLQNVSAWIRRAGKVVALTGAGISTDSGIPDFRGPQGLWTKDPKAERLATLQAYVDDKDVRVTAWRLRLEHPVWRAAPNKAHSALAALEHKGKLETVITQNIDGLHQKAGSSQESVVEIHGTIREVVCLGCGERAPMHNALERVRAGEADPSCRTCGGILKSATISFGQKLVERDLRRAQLAARTCDVFLSVGTSLLVYPAAALPRIALANGARVVIFNDQPTPYDGAADAVVRAPLGESLPALVDLV